MSFDFLLAALSLVTLSGAVVFALWSKKRTEKKLNDPNAPKSSLAKDGPGPQPLR